MESAVCCKIRRQFDAQESRAPTKCIKFPRSDCCKFLTWMETETTRRRRPPKTSPLAMVHRIGLFLMLAGSVIGTTARLRRRIPNAIDAGDHIILLPPNSSLESAEESGFFPSTVHIFATFPPAPHSFSPFPVFPSAVPIPSPTTDPRSTELPSESEVTSPPNYLLTSQPSQDLQLLTHPPSPSPSIEPTSILPSTFDTQQTATPSSNPTALTLGPTVSPTSATFFPTTSPTDERIHTQHPSLRPSSESVLVSTMSPNLPVFTPASNVTYNPTMRTRVNDEDPTLRPDPTTMTVQMAVPFDFVVNILLGDGTSTTLDDVRLAWEGYLTSTLAESFDKEAGVRVLSVGLNMEEDPPLTNLRTRGEAVFEIDESVVDWRDFSHRVRMVLREATKADKLQQPLQMAGAQVREREMESLTRPPLAQIVAGFTILFLTLLSLAFWARYFWKKRRKRLRKQRLESLRKAQSTTVVAMPPIIPPPPLVLDDQEEKEVIKTISQDIPPLDTPVSAGDTETTNSDPFAAELQRAVSMDRVAWNEFQKQREAFGQERAAHNAHRMLESTGDEGTGLEVLSPLNSSTYSYPYGDEMSAGVLNSRMDTSLTTIGENITSPSRFEPYGDGGKTPVDGTWGAEEHSAFDRSQLQLSTMLGPLRLGPKGRSEDEETPTSGALHDSTEVSTIETMPNTAPDENVPTEFDEDLPASVTESMVREVESIANFLRQYEQSRQKRSATRSTKQSFESYSSRAANDDTHRVADTSLEAQDLNALGASLAPVFSRFGGRTALQPVPSQRLLPDKVTQAQQLSERHANPVQNQGRLGISQFSLGSPLSKMGSYKLKPSTGAVRFQESSLTLSPVPSEDPLQFIPSGSVEEVNADVFAVLDPDFDSLDDMPNSSFQSQHSRLSSLRSNESILDVASEDFSYSNIPSGSVPTEPVSSSNFHSPRIEVSNVPAATISSTKVDTAHVEESNQSEDSSQLRRKRISPRSNNLTFNNIRSIFEEKITEPIVPPSDTVSNSESTDRDVAHHRPIAVAIYRGPSK